MKVLLIHQAFASPSEGGGTRHYEFARRCVDEGHEFSVVASTISYLSGQRSFEGKGLVQEQQIDGIRVLRAYAYPSLHRSFFWRIISFLSFMITSTVAALRVGNVDVVMGTSPPIFQAVSSWFVATLRRRPFLLEIRDLWPEFAVDMGVLTNPILITLSQRMAKFLYKRSSHIVVNSPAYRDHLLANGISSSKISLIPNGVDTRMFQPHNDGASVRREFGVDQKFVAIYGGALGAANDIDTILHGARQLLDHPEIHFLLVGDGKERARLEALCDKLGLSNVTFVGSRPKEQMKDFLAAADVGIATLRDIPMFRTTYPNKVFDYMAAGIPTVLAIDGVIRDVIDAAEAGIFTPPGNSECLAGAVLALSEQRDRAKDMGHSARAYVEKHFNRDKQAREFINLLHDVAGCRR